MTLAAITTQLNDLWNECKSLTDEDSVYSLEQAIDGIWNSLLRDNPYNTEVINAEETREQYHNKLLNIEEVTDNHGNTIDIQLLVDCLKGWGEEKFTVTCELTASQFSDFIEADCELVGFERTETTRGTKTGFLFEIRR